MCIRDSYPVVHRGVRSGGGPRCRGRARPPVRWLGQRLPRANAPSRVMELHRRRQGLIADRRSCTNLATTTKIDYSAFDALTFDCYGTLIDWETGILAGLPVDQRAV